jgi:hypothetical protein
MMQLASSTDLHRASASCPGVTEKRMRDRWTGLCALVLSAVATPAAALQQERSRPPDPSAREQQEIVVQGQRLTRDAVDDFVDDVTVDVNGQIAMFRAPICPFVDGFVDAQNKKIEQRIRQVAQIVGVPVARGECSPNVVLMTAKDAPATLRKLTQEKPVLFQGILPSDVRGLLGQKGPVWTWQTIVESGSDGRSSPSSKEYKTGSSGVNGQGASNPRFEENPGAFRTNIHSRILKTTRPDLFTSFILIEFDAVKGLTPTQIADYATIRTLARTQAKPTLRQRTMLRLFDVPPDLRAELHELTPWDLAYLHALYKSSNGVSASLQTGAIATEMRRRFQKDRAAAQP